MNQTIREPASVLSPMKASMLCREWTYCSCNLMRQPQEAPVSNHQQRRSLLRRWRPLSRRVASRPGGVSFIGQIKEITEILSSVPWPRSTLSKSSGWARPE